MPQQGRGIGKGRGDTTGKQAGEMSSPALTHISTTRGLVQMQILIQRGWGGPGFCLSHKLPGHCGAAGLRTSLQEARG